MYHGSGTVVHTASQ